MKCKEITELLSTYIDGELSQAEMSAVEKHLEGCAQCAEELARLKQVVGMVADLPPVNMSEAASRKLEAAIEDRLASAEKTVEPKERTPWWKWFTQPAFGAIAASAAVLVLAVVLTSPQDAEMEGMRRAPSSVEDKAAKEDGLGGTELKKQSASVTRADIDQLTEDLNSLRGYSGQKNAPSAKPQMESDAQPNEPGQISAEDAAKVAAGKKQVTLISSTIAPFEGQEAWIITFVVKDIDKKSSRGQAAAVSLDGRLLYLAK